MAHHPEPSASPSAASPAAEPDPWVGRVLAGRYRIDARLGSGGMGAVYRGHHLALDRPVAIKVLHARLTEDPVVARRFDREALAASKLDHPGCVQMLDAGTTDDGTKFLVMQLLSGRELWTVQDGPLPPDRAVELSLQILRALEHAHRRGLVHRDLKPENVIVTRDDDDREVVKILDFGIVKLLSGDEGDDKLTRAGMVFGTPRYMSPEQAAGGKVDARADLYTVGVLLYEMLAGHPPFSGDDMGIVLRMHILADPPPLPEHVPGPIAAVIMRLLQKRAADRYATAKETHDALQAAIAATLQPTGFAALPASGVAHTVVALPTPVPTPTPPAAARRDRGMIGSIVALLVLALGLVIGWALLSPSEDRAPEIEISRPPLHERAAELPVGAMPGSAEDTAAEDPNEADEVTPRDDDARRDDDPPVKKPPKRDREARKTREAQEREARKRREEQEREARKRRDEKGRKGRGRGDGKGRDD